MQFMLTWMFEFSFLASLAVCGLVIAPPADAQRGAALSSAGSSLAVSPWPSQDQDPPVGNSAQGDNHAEFHPEYREGRRVEKMHGSIRVAKDRFVFFPEDEAFRFVLLENLSLERIARAMAGDVLETKWEIDAVITEFRGANFLLIERAQMLSD